MEWKEWLASTVAFLSGLAAIWGTLRAVRRKDRAQDVRLGQEEEHTEENAVKAAWQFARNREKWYNEERRTFLLQLATKDELIEQLRTEIHGARNAWSEEQLKRVRLEETVKWLTAELEELKHGRTASDGSSL
jgi:hypothetical protein